MVCRAEEALLIRSHGPVSRVRATNNGAAAIVGPALFLPFK
jgi:hypothetical protein